MLLLLLSNCEPGCGGTAIIPGSHKDVHEKLIQVGAEGIPHSKLNEWCVDRVLEGEKSGEIRIAVDSVGTDCGDATLLHQIVGNAGDVICMHPLAIHCGTTNLSPSVPRLMGNGMVRYKAESFERKKGLMYNE